MNVAIREADERDVPALTRLISQLGYRFSEVEVAGRLQRLAGQGYPVLVADDGGVIGCLTWNIMTVLHRETRVSRISMLVVADDRRSDGIGRSLVEKAEARMAGLGCSLIEVTSNETLIEAHRFYERLGYGRTSFRFGKVLQDRQEKR